MNTQPNVRNVCMLCSEALIKNMEANAIEYVKCLVILTKI